MNENKDSTGHPQTVIEPTTRTYQQTVALRWRASPETTTTAYVLEQAWICRETGEISWRPVPVEVVS